MRFFLKFIFRFSTFDLNHLWRTLHTLRPQECEKLKKDKKKESGSRPGPERARTLWGYSQAVQRQMFELKLWDFFQNLKKNPEIVGKNIFSEKNLKIN